MTFSQLGMEQCDGVEQQRVCVISTKAKKRPRVEPACVRAGGRAGVRACVRAEVRFPCALRSTPWTVAGAAAAAAPKPQRIRSACAYSGRPLHEPPRQQLPEPQQSAAALCGFAKPAEEERSVDRQTPLCAGPG